MNFITYKQMKTLLSKYYTPTPVIWRKIGDTILIVGTIISTTILAEYEKAKELFAMTDLKGLVTISIICTVLGKIVTNFASEVPPTKQF